MLPNETATALGNYVGQISELHSDRAAINERVRKVYAEAKAAGFDVTAVRQIVKEHKMEGDARAALYRLLDDYRGALGMFADTPLGEAALARAADSGSTSRTIYVGAAPRRRGRPRKPFSEQPILPQGQRRGPGRKKANGKASAPPLLSIDDALAAGRRHLDDDDLPPAA